MDWIKVLHLLAVMGWMAGVFVAPRGLIYWKREWAATGLMGPAGELTFRVWRFSAGLMVVALVTGLILAWSWNFAAWIWVKLGFVALLALHYLWTGGMVIRAKRGEFRESDFYLRVYNEVSVLVALVILWVVVFKPF